MQVLKELPLVMPGLKPQAYRLTVYWIYPFRIVKLNILLREKPNAVGLRFHAKHGEKLKISLVKKPIEDFAVYVDLVYVDLWQSSTSPDKPPKLVLAAEP